MIQRGKWLSEHSSEAITEEEKKSVELAFAQEMEFKRTNEKLRMIDDYKTQRRRQWNQKFGI